MVLVATEVVAQALEPMLRARRQPSRVGCDLPLGSFNDGGRDTQSAVQRRVSRHRKLQNSAAHMRLLTAPMTRKYISGRLVRRANEPRVFRVVDGSKIRIQIQTGRG